MRSPRHAAPGGSADATAATCARPPEGDPGANANPRSRLVKSGARLPAGRRVPAVARVTELREHGAARVRARSEALFEEAAERSRPSSVMERLRANWRWFA